MSENPPRVTRKDLLDMVVEITGVARADAQKCIDTTFELIGAALREDQTVSIRGFGVIDMRERPARSRVDPRTGQNVQVPAKRAPRLRLTPAKT